MAKTKEKLLEFLKNGKGKFVSGQSIAEELKISRTAVWKAVNSLKDDGYKIESVQNNGYKLSSESDVLSETEIKNFLLPEYKNFDIKIFKTIDSTNNYAKKLIAGNNFDNGTIIIANEQTGGRGRFGRTFFSPANTGIYLTAILKTSFKLNDISLMTIISALAVCRALKKLTSLKPQIKWINDIYIDGKKICGILTEAVSSFETQTSEAVIVGIGINTKTKKEDFPEELQNKAGSVMIKDLSRNILTAEILNNLFLLSERIYDKKIIEEYKSLSMILNKEIKYIDNETVITATAEDINEKGNLIVKTSDGKTKILKAGEISLKKI